MQHSNIFWRSLIDTSSRIHWSFTLVEPCFFTQTPICVTLVLRGIAWYWYCMILHDIAWYCMVLHDIAWFYTHRPPSVSLLSWNQHFTRLPWPRSPCHYIALHVITSDLRSHFIIFSAFQIICSNHFHFYQHRTHFTHCCKSSYSILSYHHPLLTMIMMPMMILTSRPVKNILRIFIPARATQRTNDWKHKAAAAEGLETSLNDRNPQNSSQDETHFITAVTSNVGDWT